MSKKVVNIYMNGMLVGKLEKTRSGILNFQYCESWLDTPGTRPISLSLPLVDTLYSGERVYNFFDNLLPDNPNLRKRIQTKFKLSSDHPFDLLECIGRDCIGAIQIVAEDDFKFEKKIKFKTLSEKKIADRLINFNTVPLGMSDETDDFRISLAGVQEKSAFLFHKGKWCIPLGETPTTHIFKLPIGINPYQQIVLRDSCENEWLCAQIAASFNLDTAHCEILHFENVKTLVVERFDRKVSQDKSWIFRLPQEDICQALGVSPNLKYQSDGGPGIKDILNILLGSSDPVHARNTFFKVQILFWLLAAIDGHAKNFSIFIKPDGRYELTPLYDIISTYPLINNKQLSERKIKMAMALKGKNIHYKWFECKRVHFLETAKYCKFSVKVAESLLDEMLSQVDDVIDKVSNQIPLAFNEQLASSIFDGMYNMKKRLSS